MDNACPIIGAILHCLTYRNVGRLDTERPYDTLSAGCSCLGLTGKEKQMVLASLSLPLDSSDLLLHYWLRLRTETTHRLCGKSLLDSPGVEL